MAQKAGRIVGAVGRRGIDKSSTRKLVDFLSASLSSELGWDVADRTCSAEGVVCGQPTAPCAFSADPRLDDARRLGPF